MWVLEEWVLGLRPGKVVEVPERIVGHEGGSGLASLSPGRLKPLGRKHCAGLPAGLALKCLRLVPWPQPEVRGPETGLLGNMLQPKPETAQISFHKKKEKLYQLHAVGCFSGMKVNHLTAPCDSTGVSIQLSERSWP